MSDPTLAQIPTPTPTPTATHTPTPTATPTSTATPTPTPTVHNVVTVYEVDNNTIITSHIYMRESVPLSGTVVINPNMAIKTTISALGADFVLGISILLVVISSLYGKPAILNAIPITIILAVAYGYGYAKLFIFILIAGLILSAVMSIGD